VVKNHAGNTLIFDLAVPYKFRLSDRQIREMTVGGINAIDKNAVPIVSIERQLAELD
jgi:hypothetical protein